ncbi:unnamed protein product [Durusdinium trenchii]|uniref:Uncharacterized protein n=1 Tax=Durusdinium trenchii TaxID=1381693 RepID=A0ABP0RA99_9DINO
MEDIEDMDETMPIWALRAPPPTAQGEDPDNLTIASLRTPPPAQREDVEHIDDNMPVWALQRARKAPPPAAQHGPKDPDNLPIASLRAPPPAAAQRKERPQDISSSSSTSSSSSSTAGGPRRCLSLSPPCRTGLETPGISSSRSRKGIPFAGSIYSGKKAT